MKKLSAITVADRLKAVAGVALTVFLAVGTTGNDTIDGELAFGAAVLLALGVKPLGPASKE